MKNTKKKPLFPKFWIFKEVTELASDIPIARLMARDLKVLRSTDSVRDAIEMMAKNSLSSIIVVNERKEPVGIITTGDMIKKVFYPEKDIGKLLVRDIMSSHVDVILPSATIGDASTLMKNKKIRRLPVVDEKNHVVGMITSTDLMRETNQIYLENRKLLWNAGLLNLLYLIFGMIIILQVANLFVK